MVVQLSWLSDRALAAQARCSGFDFQQLPAFYFCLRASRFSLICSQAMIYCCHHTPCQGQIASLGYSNLGFFDQKACICDRLNIPTGSSQQSVSHSVALPCHEAFISCHNVMNVNNLLPYTGKKDLDVWR